LIPITDSSHPWPALGGETYCTELEYMHCNPAIVTLVEEDSKVSYCKNGKCKM
jgi:hypothetical protein